MRGQLFTPNSAFENAVKVESGVQRPPRALFGVNFVQRLVQQEHLKISATDGGRAGGFKIF
jgi:hypothetical protein